jgi:hypothetical protein
VAEHEPGDLCAVGAGFDLIDHARAHRLDVVVLVRDRRGLPQIVRLLRRAGVTIATIERDAGAASGIAPVSKIGDVLRVLQPIRTALGGEQWR